jgi:hypothetical protein
MRKLLIALMFAGSAHANVYENGNTLLREIEDTNFGKMYALGYIVGVADAHQGNALCVPSTVTKGQLLDVTHQFLRSKPQHRDLAADVLILIALGEHWVCPKSDKRKKS